MGQAQSVYCRTCKIYGHLVYGSWRMHLGGAAKNLTEYEAEVQRMKGIEKDVVERPEIRSWFLEHDGHDLDWYGEYSFPRDGKLVFEDPFGEDQVQVENWSEFREVDLIDPSSEKA